MKEKLNKISNKKTSLVRDKIHEAVHILDSAGVPLADLTPRRIEKMAMCLLALCNITPDKSWKETSSIEDKHILGSREIITYINNNFEEDISLGSYDDIRRKDLLRLVGMGLVIKSANNPTADNNDGTRKNALNQNFVDLIKTYSTEEWNEKLSSFEIDQEYINQLTGMREIPKLEVILEDGVQITLDDGPHNRIQQAIIDKFLPIYGHKASVLYIGDTTEKYMHKNTDKMKELGLNVEDRGMLPDIVAFSEEKKWVYLIEAVHSSNPLNPERCIELKRTVLKNCSYGVVFVTAFLTKKDFSKWFSQIAWETEVWLVDSPEHMIHLNGDKFLGPHDTDPYVS